VAADRADAGRAPRPGEARAGDAAASPTAASRRDRLVLLAIGVVVALQLVPLARLRYLPTQDGPSHQALAYAMRVYDQPAGAPLRQYLVRNREALPNWFVFFLQADLLRFLSTAAAERVLLAAYAILLPLGLRTAVRAVSPGAGFLAALGLPFTYSYMATMGFLNFCWSLAAFLFALGFFLRRRARFVPRHLLPATLLVLWVYFCHPVTLVMLLAAVGVVGLWDTVDALRAGGEHAHGWWRAVHDRLVLPLLPFVPALVLLGLFVGERLHRRTSGLPLLSRAKQLVGLYTLVSLDRRTIAVALGTALLIGVLALLALRQRARNGRSPHDALLAVALVYALVCFVAPSELAGGAFLVHRLELFPPLVLIVWLAAAGFSSRARTATVAIAAALALVQLALISARWSLLAGYVEEAVAVAERVPDDATLLPLSFAHGGPQDGELAFRVWPFVHLAGYVAGHRPVVDLGLYEAMEDYFPLRFRPELDPYRHLAPRPEAMEAVPPVVDIAGFERRGGRVDYVLLWQPGAADPADPRTEDLYRQLASGYRRALVSARGNAELWQRRSVPVG